MAKAPDHMAGINNLPRWDRANPTTYAYDWRNYDPKDYQAFKEARAKKPSNKTARAKEVTKHVSEALKQGYKNRTASRKELTADQIKQAAKAGHVLRAELPSTCFASVTWEATDDSGTDGIVTGEFYRGGSIVYDGEMTLDEFQDFASSDSLGKWYNENKPF
jgi:hypothetical protein